MSEQLYKKRQEKKKGTFHKTRLCQDNVNKIIVQVISRCILFQ